MSIQAKVPPLVQSVTSALSLETPCNGTLTLSRISSVVLDIAFECMVSAVDAGTTQDLNGIPYDVDTFGGNTLLIEDNTVQVLA